MNEIQRLKAERAQLDRSMQRVITGTGVEIVVPDSKKFNRIRTIDAEIAFLKRLSGPARKTSIKAHRP